MLAELLIKMLQYDPTDRCSITEVVSSGWLTQVGYSPPPDLHLPTRKPLTLPLDPAILAELPLFTDRSAETEFETLLNSNAYHSAVAEYQKKKADMADASAKTGGAPKRRAILSRIGWNPRVRNDKPIDFFKILQKHDPCAAGDLAQYYLVRERIAKDIP